VKVCDSELELAGRRDKHRLLGNEHKGFHHSHRNERIFHLFVTRLHNLHIHRCLASFSSFDEIGIGVFGVLGHLDALDFVCALRNAPIKSKTIKATEDITFLIVARNMQVLVVVDVKLAVVRLDGDRVDLAHLGLAAEHLARV